MPRQNLTKTVVTPRYYIDSIVKNKSINAAKKLVYTLIPAFLFPKLIPFFIFLF